MFIQYGKNFFLFDDIDKYENFVHYKTGELLSGRQFLQMINNEIPWQTTKRKGTNEAAFYDQTLYSPKETKGKNPQYSSAKIPKGVHSGIKVDSSFLISYKYIDNKNRERVNSEIVNFNVIEKHQTKGFTDKQLADFLARKVAKGTIKDAKIHTRLLKHQLCIVENHPLYFISNKELNNAKQLQLKAETVEKLYTVMNNNNFDSENAKNIFAEIAEETIDQYKNFLPSSRVQAIRDYVESVKDKDSYLKGIDELFKTCGAGPSRSNIFGGRYERKLNPKETKFVHQSITGLKYRKPKSFKKELWLK